MTFSERKELEELRFVMMKLHREIEQLELINKDFQKRLEEATKKERS